MHDQHDEDDPRYDEFVRTAVRRRLVYTLQDEEYFFAECPSEMYDDDLGDPYSVQCFWSSRQDALACRQDEWADYEVQDIALEEFIGEILTDMDAAAHLAGVGFDEQLYGSEVEPMDLLADLLDEIQAQGMEDEFDEFDEWQQRYRDWEQAVSVPAPVIH